MASSEVINNSRTAAKVLADSRDLLQPALRAAVDTLPASMRSIAGYHLGWWDEHDEPTHNDSGKALRPRLTPLCAQAVPAEPEVTIPAAVAVELVHNFSLLHDDVMDRDLTRRHRPTAWTVFDSSPVILAGDALPSLAVDVLAASGHPREGRHANDQRRRAGTARRPAGRPAPTAKPTSISASASTPAPATTWQPPSPQASSTQSAATTYSPPPRPTPHPPTSASSPTSNSRHPLNRSQRNPPRTPHSHAAPTTPGAVYYIVNLAWMHASKRQVSAVQARRERGSHRVLTPTHGCRKPDDRRAGEDRRPVGRQRYRDRTDGRPLGERLSDGLSAWKRSVHRTGWEHLLKRVKAGESDGIVVWHTDRLFRQPRDLEALIDLADKGFQVASARGARDLSDPDDRFILRIEVAHAARSSDDTSRRLKRRFQTLRANGQRTGGARPFGLPGFVILPATEREALEDAGENARPCHKRRSRQNGERLRVAAGRWWTQARDTSLAEIARGVEQGEVPRLPGDFQTRFDHANRGRKSEWLHPRSTRMSCGNARYACTGSPSRSR